MNADKMRQLAEGFSTDLTSAQLAKQGQSLLAIAQNLEAALSDWQAITAVMDAFRALKIELGATHHQIEALKQNPHTAVQALILLPQQDLAKKPASTFHEHSRNASDAKQLLTNRWTLWANEALASLSVLEPVLDRIAALAPLKPKIAALKRERRSAPPSNDAEVKAVQDWLKRCRELSAEANRSLAAGSAAFIEAATKGDGIWLDLVSQDTLEWIIKNGFARFLRVKFYETPNPTPAAQDGPSEASSVGEDDDWP